MEDIRDYVKAFKEKTGITYAGISKNTGINANTIRSWLSGKPMSEEKIKTIKEFIDKFPA